MSSSRPIKANYSRGVSDDYERLKADPEAWKSYQDEIRLLEGGAMDGLVGEDSYYIPDEEAAIRDGAARARIAFSESEPPANPGQIKSEWATGNKS